MASRITIRTLTLLFLALVGCANDGPPRGMRGGGTGGAPMTASGELADPNPKPMDGHGSFFANQIEVEAMLAKSDVAWKKPGSGESPGESRGGGSRGGGFGMGLGGGMRGGGRGGMGGSRAGNSETRGGMPAAEARRGPATQTANAAPVQLRLRLTNHGTEPVEAEVLDFNSSLGNFVVQPTKLTLPPNQPVEAEPMISQLGVPAAEEIPVTVRIRIGGKTGRVESQVLKLRPRADALEPAASPPPPGS